MKNFFPANCFRKDIEIYNALDNTSFRVRDDAGSKAGTNAVINRSETATGVAFNENTKQ